MRYTDEYIARAMVKLQNRLERGIISRAEFENTIDAMNGLLPDFTPNLRRQLPLDEYLAEAAGKPVSPEELRVALSQGVDLERRKYFVAQIQSGDEIWEWSYGGPLSSTFGVVIIRNGQPIDYLVTGWS